jgi:hypothetical protein
MTAQNARLDAILEALRAVREHVNAFGGEDVTVGDYNRWVGQLGKVVNGDGDALILDGGETGTAPAGDMIMNIDAAIAFLEDYRDTQSAIAS